MPLSPSNQFLLVFGIIMTSISSVFAQDPTTYFDAMDTAAYTVWLQDTTTYEKSIYIPSAEAGLGAAIHWSIDDTNITLAVAVKATGWVGFGIAEAGGMLGADIALYTAETDEVVDTYVLDQLAFPLADECQSWTLINSINDGGFIIFEATRLLDTQDTQDRPIIDDTSTIILPTRVIAAWGDDVNPGYHGTNNRVRGSIRFYGPAAGEELAFFEQQMADEAEGSFELRATDYEIPAVETTYASFCFTESELIAMGVPTDTPLHSIGVEPFVDADAIRYVHHFILFAAETDYSGSDCDEDFPGFEQAFIWAPGDLPVVFPSNVGGPLGAGGFRSFQLEIHYNNPDGDMGVLDSSGIKMYWTSNKRPLDLGILQTGDPQVELEGRPVSASGGLSQHSFDCEGGCSALFLDEPITVLREHLHMHASGASIKNEQIRNGQVVRQGTVEYWDFDQQGNMGVVQAPFEIEPGDAFRTTCNFQPSNGEVFGLGSAEEMCIAFLYYYPRKMAATPFGFDFPYSCGIGFGDLIPGCEADWVERDLSVLDATAVPQSLFRSFGTAPETCQVVAVETLAPTPATTESTPAPTPAATTETSPAPTPPPTQTETTPAPTFAETPEATMVPTSSAATISMCIFILFTTLAVICF